MLLKHLPRFFVRSTRTRKKNRLVDDEFIVRFTSFKAVCYRIAGISALRTRSNRFLLFPNKVEMLVKTIIDWFNNTILILVAFTIRIMSIICWIRIVVLHSFTVHSFEIKRISFIRWVQAKAMWVFALFPELLVR